MASTPPFLRLPREIRDMIYEYYVFEEDGYHYDFYARKLRRRCFLPLDGGSQQSQPVLKPVALDLAYTCKVIGVEMRGVALKVNTVTFTPAFQTPWEGRQYRKIRSKATRFECIRTYALWLKMDMLMYAAPRVMRSLLGSLRRHFPDVSPYFEGPLQESTAAGNRWFLPGSWPVQGGVENNEQFRDALQYALEQAQSMDASQFEATASEAFVPEPEDVYPHTFLVRRAARLRRPAFQATAMSQVLHWKLSPWTIPVEKDLSPMEALLTRARENIMDVDLHRSIDRAGRYFSAAAVAIDFMQGSEHSYYIQNIILKETRISVAGPECHGRGLVPIYARNPKLRIERRIALFDNMMIPHWVAFPHRHELQPRNVDLSYDVCLDALTRWMDEATALPTLGLPAKSFTLVLRIKEKETIHLWKMVKLAAGLQEAMERYIHDKKIRPPTQHDELGYGTYRFELPCHLPKTFSRTVKGIIQKEGNIVLDGEPGELWDAEELYETRRNWTMDAWWVEWFDVFSKSCIPAPSGWLDRCSEAYLQDRELTGRKRTIP
ncbi:hypothetical protein BDV96DRAFT_584902 [Lophiotrema nucula]|uniref:Uncharacterized protein n=1 Tax=Lophiotrema nucula TaxID=690887 RepID=A0A6A5YTB8_9PLEO|nr:hypothetical protein BDV96DRAFT_584902 [Lophiotrema nucula]